MGFIGSQKDLVYIGVGASNANRPFLGLIGLESVHLCPIKMRICFVCDFFLPNIGGVEKHILHLSQHLLERGHHVVVLTHAYTTGDGVVYSGEQNIGNLRVYYVPRWVIHDQVTFPNPLLFYNTFREILLRERIDIVHGHQSTSTMAHECLFIARTLGVKTVLTEHSLYDSSSSSNGNFFASSFFSFDLFVNKVLEITVADIDHIICVSNSCLTNVMTRTNLMQKKVYIDNPNMISMIPNAFTASQFQPITANEVKQIQSKGMREARTTENNNKNGVTNYMEHGVTVVLLSRLVQRKGIDLVAQIIPRMCEKYPYLRFLIGGDGPKKQLLENMITQHQLASRVELLGSIPFDEARDVLIQGDIFLNCSYTESFCISLLEAAACGLQVVSTNVGGVPEVLPPHLISLCEVDLDAIIQSLGSEVEQCIQNKGDNILNEQQQDYDYKSRRHQEVARLYSWQTTAMRTEQIYSQVLRNDTSTFHDRLHKYANIGFSSNTVFAILLLILLEVIDYMTTKIMSIAKSKRSDMKERQQLEQVSIDI